MFNIIVLVTLFLNLSHVQAIPKATATHARSFSGSSETATNIFMGLQKSSIRGYSPAGLDADICALLPAMNPNESSKLQYSCKSDDDVKLKTAIWISSDFNLNASLQSDIRSNAELFVERPPFVSSISSWLKQNGEEAISENASVFTAINVMKYSSNWAAQFPRISTKRGVFHGERKSSTVEFLHGRALSILQTEGSCQRVATPLVDGGHVYFLKKLPGPLALSLACLHANYRQEIPAKFVMIAVPKISVFTKSDLGVGLEHSAKYETVFSNHTAPFNKIDNRLSINRITQFIAFRLDELGVGVKTTTVTNFALGVPGVSGVVNFDSPFLVEITTKANTNIAIFEVTDF